MAGAARPEAAGATLAGRDRSVKPMLAISADSQRVLAEQTAHLDPDVRDGIVGRNTARLYGLDATDGIET
jgi:hypothetical protein